MVKHGFKSKIDRLRGQTGAQFVSLTIELIHIGKTFNVFELLIY